MAAALSGGCGDPPTSPRCCIAQLSAPGGATTAPGSVLCFLRFLVRLSLKIRNAKPRPAVCTNGSGGSYDCAKNAIKKSGQESGLLGSLVLPVRSSRGPRSGASSSARSPPCRQPGGGSVGYSVGFSPRIPNLVAVPFPATWNPLVTSRSVHLEGRDVIKKGTAVTAPRDTTNGDQLGFR